MKTLCVKVIYYKGDLFDAFSELINNGLDVCVWKSFDGKNLELRLRNEPKYKDKLFELGYINNDQFKNLTKDITFIYIKQGD